MKDLTLGREGAVIFRFATPMLLGNLFQQAYYFVDSMIVGRLIGDEALAAVGASGPVIFALISFVIGIASGGTIIIAQFFGARDFDKVKRAIDTILIFTFFMSIIVMVAGIGFSRQIFEITRLPAEIVPEATIYLNTFLSGTILLFGFNGISAILRGTGDSKTPLYFLIASTLLNIVLDIVFIKYFRLGIRGAALATVTAQGFTFLVAVLYLNRTHKLVRIKLRGMVFDRKIFAQSVNIGLPSGFQQTFVSLGMIALYRIINNFGTDVITAYSAAGRIENLAMLPAMTFGQALSTFVGQNIGAGKINRVRAGLRSTLLISIGISFAITALVILLRFPLMRLFSTNQHVINAGAEYLVIVSSAYFIFSIMFSLNGIMRGSGDTLIPMFITLFSLWIIRIPIASLLSGRFFAYFAEKGVQLNLPELFQGGLAEWGVWFAVPIAWATGAVFSFLYYKTGRWKKKTIVKQ
ncbi:MAG: MATE family efflux transporter [Bacteroidales bacterium]|nr:MATE family efflux transporter [Bacteroidales bacterium]